MSMPPLITLNLVSEQNPEGGEIVVAAAAALDLSYLVITPVSSHKTLRQEFLSACGHVHGVTSFKYYSKVVEPAAVRGGTFWLAFDTASESIARQIVENWGSRVDEGEYDFPGRVGLLEPFDSYPPADSKDLISWLELFTEQLSPWKKKIRKMQSDYS